MTAPTCARPGCKGPRETDGFCGPDYRYRLHTGRGGLRGGGLAREHLRQLREVYGWTWDQIAAEAVTGTANLYYLYTGRVKRIRARNEQAILAVPLRPAGESRRGVPSTGTRRRVQALMRMGWPGAVIAERAGYSSRSLLARIYVDRVSVRMATRVLTVYDELANHPGPSNHTAGKARQHGHAPPAAWDGIDMDDPKARPCGVRREAAA